MAVIKVKIIPGRDHFTVTWKKSEAPKALAGIVAVTSMKKAEALKAHLEAGMAPAYAIRATLVPPRRKRPGWVEIGAQYGAVGGAARAASMTPEKRREIAQAAAAARWGKKVEPETEEAK